MKRFTAFFVLVFAVFCFAGIDATAQSFAPAAKASRSVDEQVYRKLRGLMRSNVFDYITWQVNGDTVTLSGKVHTMGTKREAASRVKDIAGVTRVVNNIDELPPSPFDDRIRRAAYAEFTSRGPAQYFGHPNPDVRIIVENGRMTLEGYVAREADSDLLNVLAHGIPGIFEVTNNLIVGKRKF